MLPMPPATEASPVAATGKAREPPPTEEPAPESIATPRGLCHSFEMVEQLLDQHCFMRIQNAIDFHPTLWHTIDWPQGLSDSYTQGLSDSYFLAYNTVYSACTQKPPHNLTEKLFELVRSRVQLVGEKYPAGSMKRHRYVKYVQHVFMYLNRFYMKKLRLGDLDEVIEKAMEEGKRRAATLRRWRLVKHRIVRLEWNAKVEAAVDRWLIKNEKQEMMDAKSAFPHIKSARLV